jgi:hypothetical protein
VPVILLFLYTHTFCSLQINIPKRFLKMRNFASALTVLAFIAVGYAQTVGPFNHNKVREEDMRRIIK